MKKKGIIKIVLILATVLMIFSSTAFAAETNETVKLILRGDVNFDDILTVSDLSMIKEFLVDKIQFEGEQRDRADVSGDKQYTALDISLLKMILVGLKKPTYMNSITTVEFRNYDGTLLQTVVVNEGDEAIYTGATPTRVSDAQNDYTFSTWSASTNETTGVITKTAQYTTKVREYSITFKNYDGTVLETKQIEYGQTPTYTGATPVKPADNSNTYTFNGWGTITTVSGAKEYTAQFTTVSKTYTISFNLNGAEGTVPSQTKTNGVSLILTETEPSRIGYRFLGWAETASATLPQYSARDTYTKEGDATLYAVWETITYVISYDLNGATGTAPASQIKYHNQTLQLRADLPTRDGYNFLGWALSNTATTADYQAGGNLISGLNADTKLYAVWAIAAWDGSIATEFAGGTGTQVNPWKIATPSQLAYFSSIIDPTSGIYNSNYCDDYYEVIASLDLNNRPWLPINSINFTGSFDGNNDLGYIIKNMSIASTRTMTVSYDNGYVSGTYECEAAGLFAYNGGTIFNITLQGQITVSTTSAVDKLVVGSIVAVNKATIRGCVSSVTVNATSTVEDIEIEAGGIVGANLGATLTNSNNLGTVTATATNGIVDAGGIAGEADTSTVTGCSNTAVISGSSTDSVVGGIIGLYYAGTISGNTNTGTPSTNLGRENIVE